MEGSGAQAALFHSEPSFVLNFSSACELFICCAAENIKDKMTNTNTAMTETWRFITDKLTPVGAAVLLCVQASNVNAT